MFWWCFPFPGAGHAMNIDMHYYGTFALARAAGLNALAAEAIAAASAYTDDAAAGMLAFADGAGFKYRATAHHCASIRNIDRDDQRNVWVPFHFLPGNQGATFEERLVCRKDSELARAMVRHHAALTDRPYFLELLGIAVHVYADTFAHYGFSGISSALNRVDTGSFRFEDLDETLETHIRDDARRYAAAHAYEDGRLIHFVAAFAEAASGALGHAAAAHYPDRPYLVWHLTFEYPAARPERRDNPLTFGQAAAALFTLFRDVADRVPELADGQRRAYPDIAEVIREVLAVQGLQEERVAAWQSAIGDLCGSSDPIPGYRPAIWQLELAEAEGAPSAGAFHDRPVCRFHRAAALHRAYVLDDLLPSVGLLVA
jgi:hypothetical protein